jgi:hypothetical protein
MEVNNMDTAKVFFKVALTSLCLLLALVLSSPAMADTYTYTGQILDNLFSLEPGTPGYIPPTGAYITGSFTTASPLPFGTGTLEIVYPTTYSFTVDSVTFNPSDSSANFDLWPTATNPLAQVDISLSMPPLATPAPYWLEMGISNPIPTTPPEQDDSFSLDYFGSYGLYIGWSAFNYTPGTWTTSAAAIPEPTTMLLLGSGLIGLAGLWRKFKR